MKSKITLTIVKAGTHEINDNKAQMLSARSEGRRLDAETLSEVAGRGGGCGELGGAPLLLGCILYL